MPSCAARFAFAACFLLATATNCLAQMGTEELLEKMIEAQGGMEKLKSIKTTVFKGTIVLVAQGGVSVGPRSPTRFPTGRWSRWIWPARK